MRYLALVIFYIISVESSRARRQSIVFGSSTPKKPKECTTPDNKNGICTRLFDCPPLFTRLRTNPTHQFYTFLRQSLCNTRGSVPIVCCSTEIQTTSTTTRRTFFLIGSTKATTLKPTTQKVEPPVEPVTEAPTVAPPTEPPTETPIPNPQLRVDELLPANCGVPNVTSTTTRIVGGRIAEKGAWPWLAALGYRTTNEIEFLCGGALFTDRHILTAAHCVDQRTDLEVIRLGEHDLNTVDEAEHVDVPIEKIEAHEQYDSSNFENDIAVITLAHPVKFKRNVIPGCLPTSERLMKADFTNHRAFIAGWGSIAYNNISSPVLKEAMVPIRTNEDCQESYSRFRSIRINEQRLCAGDGGEDACQGDSGGPLMVYDFEEEKFYLYGVVSVGFRCAEPEFPGIYIKVPAYINWIMEHIV